METILLIENDPVNLVALALILRSFGYAVLEAGSQDQAVRACCEHKGPIHLVVIRAATSEVVAPLKLLYPLMRALFLSDEPPRELADKSMAGGYACLQKPFRADALAQTIKELLSGSHRSAPSSIS
jgi:CheY-like chemotaxis protein